MTMTVPYRGHLITEPVFSKPALDPRAVAQTLKELIDHANRTSRDLSFAAWVHTIHPELAEQYRVVTAVTAAIGAAP